MPAKSDPLSLTRRVLSGDRWAAVAGARIQELREGYARVTMRVEERHLNGVGVAQGGALFTLADYAFAAACNSHGTVAVALDVSITFTRGPAAGVLTAEAVEESLSRRVSVCNVKVTDAKGQVIVLFRGTAFRKEDSLADVLAADRRPKPRPAQRPRRQGGRSR